MKKVLVAAVAVAGGLAVPAAAGAEPLECKVVNGAWTKVTGDSNPFMYCIDDPHPGPGDIIDWGS
jgi:hypothetical protein